MGTIIQGLKGRKGKVTTHGTRRGPDNVRVEINGKGMSMLIPDAKLMRTALDVEIDRAERAEAKK